MYEGVRGEKALRDPFKRLFFYVEKTGSVKRIFKVRKTDSLALCALYVFS